jgi:hypothetical protein
LIVFWEYAVEFSGSYRYQEELLHFFTSKEIVIFFGAILININNGIAKRVTTVPMAIIVFMDPYSVSRWHQSESVYQSVRRSIGEGEKICTSEVSAFPS